MGCLAITTIYFFFNTVYYFFWGMGLYEDLPDSEKNKLPESTLVYTIYLLCYVANLLCMCLLIYIIGYLCAMTYQMRGVLFAEDPN